MSVPKRHHSNPIMLLKRFVNNDGFLYAFDKRNSEKGIWKTKPENIFVERHLYTQIEADGSRDSSVETKFLASIEMKAAPVLDKLVCGARKGNFPSMTPEERENWIRFFYCQFTRVPETTRKHLNEIRRGFLGEIDLLAQLRLVSDDQLAILNDEEAMDRAWRNAGIKSVTATSEEALEALSEKRICAAVIRNMKPKRSLVIGSVPVLKLSHPGRGHLSDPTVEVWLALARDVAVTPCSGEMDKVISLSNRHVESINKSIFKQSQVIAGCSRQLMESLMRQAG